MVRSFRSWIFGAIGALLLCNSVLGQQNTSRSKPIPPIARRLPPIGIEIPDAVASAATQRLDQLSTELAENASHPLASDVDVLLKAVRLALRQRELYKPQHTKLLAETLDLAANRLQQIQNNVKADWLHSPLTVRGFYSRIDDSPQPYGLVIPEDVDAVTECVLVELYRGPSHWGFQGNL